jgi:hypothetical protein
MRITGGLLGCLVALFLPVAAHAATPPSLLDKEFDSWGNQFVVAQQATDFSGSQCDPIGESTIEFNASGQIIPSPRGNGTTPVI